MNSLGGNIQLYIYTVRKAKREAAHNTRVTENSVTHIDREAQSLALTDFSDRSTWMMEFSVTLVFWSCVTLSFLTVVLRIGRDRK
jgi:hypothetical protein